MKELMNRLLVAAIGIPLGIFIIWYGSWLYLISLMILSSFALFEFNSLTKSKEVKPFFWINVIMLLSMLVFIYYLSTIQFTQLPSYQIINTLTIFTVGFAFYFVVLLTANILFRKDNYILTFTSTTGILFYILMPFASLAIIRYYDIGVINFSNSWMFLLTFFFSIWICDTAAYFIGKQWGKHKVAPAISPQKSWEGSVAGLLGAILAFYGFAELFSLNYLNFYDRVILGILIGVFGQVGDFVESSFKRDVQIKDSSHLLGEHGGILDRFDSILFTAPIVLLYIIIY